MTDLYVIGGRQRVPRNLLSNERTWYEYERGVALRVAADGGRVRTALEYVSPPGTNVEHDPQVLFKSATAVDGTLYACTQTEAMTFSLPGFEQTSHISLPCFNDVHHVRPTPAGNLLVANSGLDMCLELNRDGRVLREWNTLGEDPWARFSRDVDYRMGVSTKPHASHPNHVFYIGEEPWATRFQQKDAVSLLDPSRRIDIGLERIHDGVVHDGHVWFTTVDGKVVVADAGTLAVVEVIDLQTMHDGSALLGWCRSIHFADDGVWIGFSRIRPTKFRENIGWVAHGFKRSMATHIALYDLRARKLVREIELERHGLSAVFSIVPAPAANATTLAA
jgi:hypothetical protein